MHKTNIRVLIMGLDKEEIDEILSKPLDVSWIPRLDLLEQQSEELSVLPQMDEQRGDLGRSTVCVDSLKGLGLFELGGLELLG